MQRNQIVKESSLRSVVNGEVFEISIIDTEALLGKAIEQFWAENEAQTLQSAIDSGCTKIRIEVNGNLMRIFDIADYVSVTGAYSGLSN